MQLLPCLETVFLAPEKVVDSKTVLGVERINKKHRQILAEWVKQGYLQELTKGKKKMYLLTKVGEKQLQQDQRYWKYLQKRLQEKQQQQLCKFLQIVAQKAGKRALTVKERNTYAELIEQCLEDNSIEKISANKYRLTPDGKELQISLLPVAERIEQQRQQWQHQVASLEKQQAQMIQSLKTLTNKAETNFTQLGNDWQTTCDQICCQLQDNLDAYIKAYAKVTANLVKIGEIPLEIRKLETQVQAARDNALETVETRAREVKTHLQKVQQQTLSKLTLTREEFDTEHQQLKQKTQKMEKKLQSLQSETQQTSKPEQQTLIDDDVIFDQVREIYRQYCLDNPHLVGSMTIPELFDILHGKHQVHSLKQLHKLLLHWHDRDLIKLNVCNSPRHEPRASEGIATGYGVLFYLHVK